MKESVIVETVPLIIDEAFDTYVNQMDIWWPRQGVFPYSFAPSSTKPQNILFEPENGGRYYEKFADGSEYVIGHITEWDPPNSLTYTWRDPNWEGETSISVSFNSLESGTEITYQQTGFLEAGVPDLVPYYQIGNRQTLSGYFAHCQAVFELKKLESSQ